MSKWKRFHISSPKRTVKYVGVVRYAVFNKICYCKVSSASQKSAFHFFFIIDLTGTFLNEYQTKVPPLEGNFPGKWVHIEHTRQRFEIASNKTTTKRRYPLTSIYSVIPRRWKEVISVLAQNAQKKKEKKKRVS